MVHARPAVALVLAAATPAIAAETFLVEMAPKSTHMQMTVAVSSPLSGTFLGSYDATTNPGGTKTRPGIFGGSGNSPIPYSAQVRAGVTMDTVPAGSMRITMSDGGLFILSDLSIDMLNGDPGMVGAVLGLTYSTFHTVNPTALFIGVPMIDIPIPAGGISAMSAVQTANAIGVLEPTGKGSYDFLVLVPAEITFQAQVLDRTIDLDAVPVVLPMVGRLWRDGDSMGVEMAFSDSAEDVIPYQIDPLVDQPVDLPTILPPGNTAHLLFSGDFGELTAERSLDLDMLAEGQPTCPIFDLDGSCEFDGGDLGVLLASWGGRGPADFNGDGVVNQIDLAILLAAWGA